MKSLCLFIVSVHAVFHEDFSIDPPSLTGDEVSSLSFQICANELVDSQARAELLVLELEENKMVLDEKTQDLERLLRSAENADDNGGRRLATRSLTAAFTDEKGVVPAHIMSPITSRDVFVGFSHRNLATVVTSESTLNNAMANGVTLWFGQTISLVSSYVELQNDGLIIDGKGFSLNGQSTGTCLYVKNDASVTVIDLVITGATDVSCYHPRHALYGAHWNDPPRDLVSFCISALLK
jgi:hypothetical protein